MKIIGWASYAGQGLWSLIGAYKRRSRLRYQKDFIVSMKVKCALCDNPKEIAEADAGRSREGEWKGKTHFCSLLFLDPTTPAVRRRPKFVSLF